jgi:photosystem II stability/assembly factor-like uncharacterized protein
MDQKGHSIRDTRAELMILMMADCRKALQTLTKYLWQTAMLLFLLVIGGCAGYERCKETDGVALMKVTALSVTPNGEILVGGVYREWHCGYFERVNQPDKFFLATSSDRGKSWKTRRIPFEAGPYNYQLSGLVASKGGSLFAANRTRLLKSDDGGISWKQAYDFGDDYLRKIVVTSNSVLLAALCRQGIMRSKDNGETWTQTGLGSDSDSCVAEEFRLISSASGEVYTYAWGKNGRGYYRSTDDGLTWSKLPIPTPGQWSGKTAANDYGIVVAIPTPGPSQDEEMYRSGDHGKTWKLVTPPSGLLIGQLGVAADGTILVKKGVGLQGTRYISTDGGESWARIDNIWTDDRKFPVMDSIVTGPSGVLFGLKEYGRYLELSQSILFSEDTGRSWHQTNPLVERFPE